MIGTLLGFFILGFGAFWALRRGRDRGSVQSRRGKERHFSDASIFSEHIEPTRNVSLEIVPMPVHFTKIEVRHSWDEIVVSRGKQAA